MPRHRILVQLPEDVVEGIANWLAPENVLLLSQNNFAMRCKDGSSLLPWTLLPVLGRMKIILSLLKAEQPTLREFVLGTGCWRNSDWII